MGSYIEYTKEQKDFLKDNVKGTSYKELTKLFNSRFKTNKSFAAISGSVKRYKLKNGIDARFKKGHTPDSKGKTWDEYMSIEGQKNARKTTYKKGNLPKNTMPIGSELVRGDGYLYVKTGMPNEWKQKHRLMWEEVNGPIPEGYALLFADGDRTNITLDNLRLVSRNELVRLNQHNLIFNDAELTDSGLAVVKLINKTNKIKNNMKEGN